MLSIDIKDKLDKQFYKRDVLIVARSLLGKTIYSEKKGLVLTGKIVETEAYHGDIDKAAHTFKGKTERNKIMFEEGGLMYVYFTYGMHYCANVVTGNQGTGTAVLIRAVEPLEGVDAMALNRYGKSELSEKELINLTNGPAKFCQAFNITKEDNGTNLLEDQIYIADAPAVNKRDIITSQRVGIKKSIELPWRFYLKDNKFVSKK